jgi:hypothetical protein
MDEITNIFMIDSKINKYKANENYKFTFYQKLGSGSYGVVYDIGDGCVVKIFFHSILGKTHFEERPSVIPYKNENRELAFYFRLMKEDIKKHIENHLLPPLGIGYLTEEVKIDTYLFEKFSYFVILPLCIPFHKIFKIRNHPLLHHKDGKRFVFEFMFKMLKANQYLETEYQMIHLDIKLTNIMYLYDSSFQLLSKDDLITPNSKEVKTGRPFQFHEKMILLDYSLIKKKFQPNGNEVPFILDEFDKKNGNFQYYIWPNENENCKISHIPTYSLGISVIEILLGKERAIKSPKPEDRITMIEEIYHRYDDIGYLLKKALIEKTNIDDMFHIVKELYEKFYPK